MYRAFKHFDTDNSGTISKEELTEALKVRTLLIYVLSSQNIVPQSLRCRPWGLSIALGTQVMELIMR